MSKKIREIVKIIQAKTDQNMQGVAKSIGYSRGHLSRLVNDDEENEDSSAVENILKDKYSAILHNVTLASEGNKSLAQETFTPQQLYAMFMRVTEMQTGILQNIEKNMARQESQTIIEEKVKAILDATVGKDSNLTYVLAAVKKISIRQDEAIRDIHEGFLDKESGRAHLSRAGHNKSDQSGGDGEKQGKRRAGRK